MKNEHSFPTIHDKLRFIITQEWGEAKKWWWSHRFFKITPKEAYEHFDT